MHVISRTLGSPAMHPVAETVSETMCARDVSAAQEKRSHLRWDAVISEWEAALVARASNRKDMNPNELSPRIDVKV